MKIVITGSLGHIGQPLTATLLELGHSVTVVSSNPGKRDAIEALGAIPAIGSLADQTFLTGLLREANAVYCMVPPNYTHPDQLAYYGDIGAVYAQAIRQSGIKRVVYLSSYGAHLASGTGFITGSYRGEQLLNGLPGISLTHIRPSFFYYNLLNFIGMIKTAGFMGSVYGGEDRLTMVSPQDIAAAVADELTRQYDISPIRYVASDDRTCNEVAAVLGKAIGMPGLTWKVLPKEAVKQAMQQHGMGAAAADKYVELGEAIHSGRLRADYDLHTPVFGKITLEEYALEFAQIYHSK